MATVLGLFQEGVAMSIASSVPASVPVDLLPTFAHRLRCNVAGVLHRLAARAAVEQVRDDPVHPLSRQPGGLPRISHRRFARRAVPLQHCVAASITRHRPEAP
ncbi:hypothetical protein G8D12_18745 [Xanthomonas vesicatoria]|uniref:hypothetical protein n=1 Tax=Xanthomonas vesicatoria TaxID=56460 RepID=UPI00073213B6|nr:hypothetical protein [Xanthomonas vesicatoria]KTF37419.1 hypothetical protein LMG919_07430 [Xanthomonas vesicatoria]MCC8681562.1 hypothetical protein [Xanthomonas vesicatoria]MDG4495481.1 hypothetical protein [Xanthomonas vesicatoria]